MEQNQPPNQLQDQVNALLQTSQISPKPVISGPTLLQEKPKESYFTRLFSGRLNRQNYIVGSTVLVLLPLICFMVVIFNILLSPSTFAMPYLDPTDPSKIITPQISIPALLTTPGNELWTVLGILFTILSLPYLLSIQIRRLHDLNMNGWLWIINFLPLLFLKQTFSLTEYTHPDMWFWISNFVSLVSGVFSFYVTVWPGMNGPNKYGEPPIRRSSFLGDVMQMK
jgi:uncharacterized membrane protein YhaH (DUF805 family)